jgi:hypothetical protein
MTVAGGRTARVRVDYSQYQVAAGAEITVGDTVRIGLRRDGKGTTAVELEQLIVPVELAGLVQPFWDWALRRALPDRMTRSPFHGYPWQRV